MPDSPKPKRTRKRSPKAEERRDAIIAAAIEEFAARGFGATRIDDIAARAGIAKGTIYLYFRDKVALFEGVVQSVLVEPLSAIRAVEPEPGESVRDFLRRVFVPLLADLGTSRRGDVIRLLIGEGARFPELAESYYRAVIEPGLGLVRAMAARARERGEIAHDLPERLPQLLAAPALLAMIWTRLFQPFQPLDARALVEAQLDLMFGPQTGSVEEISMPKPESPT